MTLVPVSPVSDEFGQIEQQLQLHLSAPQLKVSECFDLPVQRVNAKFTNFSKSIFPPNIVTAFIDTSRLSQSVSDIAAKGLRIDSESGFRLTIDSLEVEHSSESIEVLRLSIALGNTLNHQPCSLIRSTACEFIESPPTPADLKPGYHSLCVSSAKHFVVFNSAQLMCTHLVRFAGGANLAKRGDADNVCDLCSKAEATVWCVNDCAKLCESCDAESHGLNHLLKRHKRIPLTEARSVIEFCPVHRDCRVEYYCPQCQIPVCVNCKMTGSHSRGPAASHLLVSIKDAYAQALESAERQDPILVRRKSAVAAKLANAEKVLKDVIANEEAIESEIRRIAEAAIQQARRLAGEKALAVRSVATELHRKIDEMEAIEQLLAAHKITATPLLFLRAADRQAALLGGLQGMEDLPIDLNVHGDLTVCGSLSVAEAMGGFLMEDGLDRSVFHESLSTPVRRKSESGISITSLALVAKRREARNRSRGIELAFQPFHGSAIVPDPEEALLLYRCFPFKAQPLTHLLFSSTRDGRSIPKMHELIDGIGITAVLLQVGEFKFGGFAAAKWNSDGKSFGESGNSFLFSLTHDAMIPYRPQNVDRCQLFGTRNCLSFGRKDLVLERNFDQCFSVLENSYGVGWPEGSKEVHTFLAGGDTFSADAVEVWGFFTIEQE